VGGAVVVVVVVGGAVVVVVVGGVLGFVGEVYVALVSGGEPAGLAEVRTREPVKVPKFCVRRLLWHRRVIVYVPEGSGRLFEVAML
jgi:hypothetical protein